MVMMIRSVTATTVLVLALLGTPAVGPTQPLPKIALLSIGTDPVKPNPVWVQFLKQLEELGYIEGRTIAFERRFAGGRQERLEEFISDLARRRVDVVVATGDVENGAAKRGLPTTPIVMMLVQDPVGSGLVASLRRPGGNVTGLTTLAPELYGKRLELLREALPAITRAGVLLNPTSPGAGTATTRERLQAVVVVTDGVTFNQRARIAELAIQTHVPLMCEVREFVLNGCLMSYGPNYGDLARRAAFYVEKILKGATPADLPVEQPTRFELVINQRTAKTLGVTLPSSLLLRADQMIE
jgi:putative ABC transport system substrate-binding protein